MKLPGGNFVSIGRRLTLTLAVLIAVILAGNGLVIYEFQKARSQTDRLTGVSQKLITVLRLQEELLSFHQRLEELTQTQDANRLAMETQPLRQAVLEQTARTRRSLAYLPAEFRVDPAFLTALDTMETTLPSQLRDIAALASLSDWKAVRSHLDRELTPMEAMTAALVKSIDRDLDEELPRAVENMQNVEVRILLMVPATALSTVLIAALFGSGMARRILKLRLEERVQERTRIARELHDTLLQSFQGVLLKFEGISYMLHDRPDTQKALDRVMLDARGAIIEGRNAVQGLRGSAIVSNDLARAIAALGQQLSAEQGEAKTAELRVHVEGTSRDMAPILRDEIYRIACEAVRNAFRHSGAAAIEVEIHFGKRQLCLLVRDDGKGIDRQVLRDGQREGHHGLSGMHERANLVGGKLAIRSEVDSGTEVELAIPSAIAYAKSDPPSRESSAGKSAG